MFYRYLSNLQEEEGFFQIKRLWEEFHFNVPIQMKGYKSIGNGAVQVGRESEGGSFVRWQLQLIKTVNKNISLYKKMTDGVDTAT